MLKSITTAFLILFFTSSFAQVIPRREDTLSATLFKVFQKARQYSLYRQQVDWSELENKLVIKTSDPISFDFFKSRVQLLFSTIGDKHAALFINGIKISAIDTPTAIRKSLIDQLKYNNPQLKTQTFEGKYGYILIPSNSTRDNLKLLAQSIQDSLCLLIDKQLSGIIIDLRANEGGGIYPLFAGLHQLIGEGPFGAFSNYEATSKTQWILKKGKITQQKRIIASVTPKCSCSKEMKVAVLLSQVTTSAGEMLAIAFKGRKNTIFIGEKTYGLTTGNVSFRIDGHLLALSASFTEDRTGKLYNGSVMPDIEITEGDNFSDLYKDKKVLEAINWFDSKSSR